MRIIHALRCQTPLSHLASQEELQLATLAFVTNLTTLCGDYVVSDPIDVFRKCYTANPALAHVPPCPSIELGVQPDQNLRLLG